MRHQIQWKVEGGDAENRTDREPANHAEMGVKARRPIERYHLTRNPPRLLGRHGERLDGATDLPLGISDRLPRLGRDGLRTLVSPSVEQRGDLLENVVPGMSRQLRHHRRRTGRRCDGLLDIGLGGLRDLSHGSSGERIDDRSRDRTLFPLALNEKWTGFLHRKIRWSLLDEGWY